MKKMIGLLFRLYGLCVVPALRAFGVQGGCRFMPVCSVYSREAFLRHGLLWGGYYTLRRLGRCHPWGGCGYDPVPASRGVSRGERDLRPPPSPRS